jgi:hypothetical protein
MAYQFIDPTECMGDSLFKINNNAANFDTRITDLISNYCFIEKQEIVTGCSTTELGYFGADTAATTSVVAYRSTVDRLADFNWKKQDGTSELVRMESVNIGTYRPWQNFFPYRPSVAGATIHTTKINARLPQMDATGSKDYMEYTFFVNWETKDVLITGYYYEWLLTANAHIFLKKWNFETNSQAEVRIDFDKDGGAAGTNTLGERNIDTFRSDFYSLNSPIKAQVTNIGITKMPLWSVIPIFEGTNISLFIENKYRPVIN